MENNLQAKTELLNREIKKVITGQEEVIEHLLIALLSGGNVIIEGVPGLAKTLIVKTLASILGLKFSRIQFTPDLMPLDIIGTEILEEQREGRGFKFLKGPIFANIILADEINRTPPKTQSALLEAMQEKRVTVAGKAYELEPPFFVLATQNPIEQEGTYPLPEAQLDRFMFNIKIFYPEFNEEVEIVKNTTSFYETEIKNILNREEILDLQKKVIEFPITDEIIQYAVEIVRATRPEELSCPAQIREFIKYGCGPRAAQFLVLAAKAYTLINNEDIVKKEYIKKMVMPVFNHRIIPSYYARTENITIEKIIETILSNF